METREIPENIRVQVALHMVERGTTKSEAAEMVEIAPTTFMHCVRGRPTAVEASHRRQTMTIEEEKMLVDRCYLLGKIGFPPPVWRVRELALEILK
jgi:predicted transcriptional regulator